MREVDESRKAEVSKCDPFLLAARVSPGTAEGMTALTGTKTASLAFTAPYERRRISIPTFRRGFQPCDDVGGCLGMTTIQRAAFDNALDGLGHVERRTIRKYGDRPESCISPDCSYT